MKESQEQFFNLRLYSFLKIVQLHFVKMDEHCTFVLFLYWKEARKIHRSPPLEDNCQLADRDI